MRAFHHPQVFYNLRIIVLCLAKRVFYSEGKQSVGRSSHSVIDQLRLEGTSGHSPVQTCSEQGLLQQLSRTVSGLLLNISRGRDSTSSLGNLLQCSMTPTVKYILLMFKWHFLHFGLCSVHLLVQHVVMKALNSTEMSVA